MTGINVFRFDASGCNGCDIEIVSTVVHPDYGVSSLGLEVVDTPEKANIMIVTGGGNEKTAPILKECYEKLQDPKIVIAMGACASSLCVFKEGYNMRGPIDTIIPVNFIIAGCPPKPQNLAKAIHAILKVEHDYSEPVWLGQDGLRARISHDSEKCTGCGACVNMCPCEAIDIVEDGNRLRISYDLWKCSFCGTCQSICPEEAVMLTSDYELWSSDKNALVEIGEMPRANCSICGITMHTHAQVEAIKSRIMEKTGMTKIVEKIDSSLSVCHDCKHSISMVERTRLDMVEWAYD